MKKILIAIDNDFIRGAYSDILKAQGFEVLETKNGNEILDLIRQEKPDLVLVDILLSEVSGFEVLKRVKQDEQLKQIPVIVFTKLERKEDRNKAIELEAKDFVSSASVSPSEMIRKIKIIVGGQKSYRLKISKNSKSVKELINDLTKQEGFSCVKCNSDLELSLLRDLSAGENHFIISVVCPQCGNKM